MKWCNLIGLLKDSNIILKYDMKLQEEKSQFTTKEIVDATNAILDDVEKY
tara:strand:- start:133 stop:282 length:150 start_codon:yes stop_codon:yes gene_type:complete